MELQNKVALVLGAIKGIGAACAALRVLNRLSRT